VRLDLIIPTFNRADLLERALASILAADPADDLEVRVVVVDNASTDGTRAVVERFAGSFGGRLRYLFEGRPGRSNALNAGIAASDGDLVGMIDDDEEIDRSWFRAIRAAFEERGLDFIGGPYLPRWGAPPPAWLPRDRPAIVGWIEGGDRIRDFGPGFDGILMGGNAVVRRDLLRRVGPYAPELGRSGNQRLMSGEDRDMFDRLLRAGGRGQFRPELRIYHFVPPERLTRSYHRRWVFWHGVSIGLLDRTSPQTVAYLAGVPRHMLGSLARGLGRLALTLLMPRGADRSRHLFAEQLRLIDLAGFLWGKRFYRAPGAKAAGPSPAVRAPESARLDEREVAPAPRY
jgi:glycosyltransferase involved in cell wall biosynthesis